MRPIYMLLVPMSPKFHSVSLHHEPFRVTGHFEKSAPNDPQMTLNRTRSNYLIYVLQVSMRPKFHCFALRPAFFEKQDILRQVHQMTPK